MPVPVEEQLLVKTTPFLTCACVPGVTSLVILSERQGKEKAREDPFKIIHSSHRF